MTEGPKNIDRAGGDFDALTEEEMLRRFPGEGSAFKILAMHPEITLRLNAEQTERAIEIRDQVRPEDTR